MAGNDTAALVVALSAQLTRFEKDMQRAGDIADRQASQIEDRFSRLNPFAGTFLGNFAADFARKGFDQAIDFVKDLTRRFTELDATAKLVGVSMNDIFGVQQAAGKAGAPVDDVTASLRNLAVLLDQLQRGEKNSLSELFDANPQALKGVNVQALNLQQTFALVADLVQNARTEIQKIDLAKAAGQSETMVKFLEQGGEAVTYLSKNAAAAAPDLQAIADSAKAFDEAWKTAVQNVKGYLAQHLFDFIKTDLQDVISLLDLAVRFLGLFKGGLIDTQAAAAASDIAKASEALKAFQSRRTQVDESAGLDTSAGARDDRRGPARVIINGQGTSTLDRNRGLSNVPLKSTGGDTQDSFDRTEEQITRHTASLRADTIAVSQNNAAQAQLRAEFQLLNAIRKDEGEVTQEQIDRYTELRASMSAIEALQQSGIQLTKEHADAFLTAASNVGQATAAFDAARESVGKINSASATLGSALGNSFADAALEAKNLNDVLLNLLKTLARAGINSFANAIFAAPSSGGLSPAASFLKGIIPGFAGGTDSAPGGLAWVGENGKELLNLPKGTQVIPNIRARNMVGGNTVQNMINVGGDVSQATVDRLQAALIAVNSKADGLTRAFTTTQRMQQTGVG
ncbi:MULTISPECIES: hypothetical protein [unclassified Bradyrhizobium]